MRKKKDTNYTNKTEGVYFACVDKVNIALQIYRYPRTEFYHLVYYHNKREKLTPASKIVYNKKSRQSSKQHF